MKRFFSDFVLRGLVAAGFGPIVLAILYLILRRCAGIESLTVAEVCVGIFSITALAFVAGGMNAIYAFERVPLMSAILIHGGVLYVGYLVTYLLNDWLARGTAPILVFTGIFAVGYLVVWVVIWLVTKRNTARVNDELRKRRENDCRAPRE